MNRNLLFTAKSILFLLFVVICCGCGGSSSGENDNPGTITLTANPTSIPANNTASSIITAVVTASTGSPVGIGTSVAFTTNLGIFSNNSRTFNTVTTDDKGTATATLIAGLTPGTATVTCTSGSATGVVKVEIQSY